LHQPLRFAKRYKLPPDKSQNLQLQVAFRPSAKSGVDLCRGTFRVATGSKSTMTSSRAVLIVDDSVASGRAIGGVLRRAGIDDVDVAESLPAAIERLNRRQYGVVIADYFVGDSTGLVLRTAMRDMPQASSVAFILLSNRGAGCSAATTDECASLTKPVDPRRLRDLVEASLAEAR